MKAIELKHPLVLHKLSILRDKETGTKKFREIISELSTMLCYEALKDAKLHEIEVETPMCKMKGVSTFMIAQVRQNQDAANNPYAEKKKAAASDADKHNAEIIIKCSADTSCTDVVKLVEETAFGTEKSVERYQLGSARHNGVEEN